MKYIFESLNIILPILIIIITLIIIMILTIIGIKKQKSYFLTIISILIIILFLIFNINNKINQLTTLLHINKHTIIYTLTTLIGSLSTCIYARQWINENNENKNEFYIFILISSLGNILIINANNLLSLLVGIELISIPTTGLIGYSLKKKSSLKATIKYKILASISLSFIIFGISLIYITTGNITYNIIMQLVINKPLAIIGFAMIIIGLGFKLSIIPFHLWISDVYKGSSIPTINFLNTTNKIAYFYATYNLILNTFIINIHSIKIILEIMTYLSIILGNLMALSQKNIKKLLAYTSITHVGNLLLVIINSKNILSFETSIIYIINYLLNSTGILGIINLLYNKIKDKKENYPINYIKGIFWKNKIHAIMLTIIILSFAGLPTTIGFISKFYIIMLTITSNLWWLTILIIFSNIIGICYYLNIIKIIFCKKENNKNAIKINKNERLQNILIYLSTICIIFIGIYPQLIINIIKINI
ncbi:NADH-quinone oxidoreductase subunit N [Candidatus Purcelliella pentastirinorum]|uniref:NADH-quinone oxidoreductase subunit N n=1 Tax=Candidatus Purcelliella pentastirinorum TaxID=472834 RepID=A0AAX3NA06_9ENTR|nr:NADH-quinone oxidoreductase subunit N [Candidatus Purcelliella pentastirinorum]WDI78366.1 NADH-quinone oxidoreductase subunit N [Candidatus Purcelliella pentastirinorum]WDR80607.1 NADH-quinone oxidoreductase subunit N [Candidatus Purcelliella pentastirinorum]